MRRIVSIVWTTKKPPRTFAQLDGGNGDLVYEGYGHEFKIGDLVEAFYDEKWDMLKMRLPKKPS